jgi:hypothetical protein
VVARQMKRALPWMNALMIKGHDPKQLATILCDEFPGRALAVVTDCLCECGDVPWDAPSYAWGSRRKSTRPEIVLVTIAFCMSDMPEQQWATGRRVGNPMVNHRLTLEHKEEFLDPDAAGYVPCDHHKRMFTAEHSRTALEMVEEWRETYGWMGLSEDVLQMLGLTDQQSLPYGAWNMAAITYFEYAHLFMMGVMAKCIDHLLHWVQTQDPNLVRHMELLRRGSRVHRP